MNTNPRSTNLHSTPTTIAQSSTEDEVAPFFIDLSSLNESSLDHLRNVGLLPPITFDSVQETCDTTEETASREDTVNDAPFDPYGIRLLREAHTAYLVKALSEPLPKGFVSLDASHPWMVYWCLHSLDLLGYFDELTVGGSANGSGLVNEVLMDVDIIQKGQLLTRVVSTLEACYTEVDVELQKDEVLQDARLSQLWQQQNDPSKLNSQFLNNTQDTHQTIKAGGFGGGPTQIPHCAPTYAAVLSLSIVASLGLQDKYSSHPYHNAGRAAFELLSQKRLQLYAFFLSLRVDASKLYGVDQKSTAFRMQHDGEIDVRASYCLLAPSYLLGLLNDEGDDSVNLLTDSAVSLHISSCQTYEGGFGAEPHNEAHGGYTFCALAALRILKTVHLIDVTSLQSWLARRQLGFEGGFCGRTNKLVDGCYSFWQGGAVAVLDGWLLEKCAADDKQTLHEDVHELTFDQVLLQRYILLCAQDVNGGLRDKPSKQRDFYHSCYNLSGLSVAQHRLPGTWPDRDHSSVKRTDELNDLFGDTSYNVIGRTDPVINIRVERVRFMLDQKLSDNTSF
jgi:protein farnesyltransferase subunit beta